MLVANFKLLSVSHLPAKEPYPPSLLVGLYDPDSSSTITLIANEATHERLTQTQQFSNVALNLSWRAIDLRSLGGSGKGKAYRLRIDSFADEDPS
jgi:hypothetical protein